MRRKLEQLCCPGRGFRDGHGQIFSDLKILRSDVFQQWSDELKPIRLPLDNYPNVDGLNDTEVDIGSLFDRASWMAKPTWARNIFTNELARTPFILKRNASC